MLTIRITEEEKAALRERAYVERTTITELIRRLAREPVPEA